MASDTKTPDLPDKYPMDPTGKGKRLMTALFTWMFESLLTPGDSSIRIIRGVGGQPGQIFANVPASVNQSTSSSPYQLRQIKAGSPSFIFFQGSYLRSDFITVDYTDIEGITDPINLADGMSVWLQLDTDGSSGDFSGASVQSGQTAPYEENGGRLMTFSGGGTGPDDPFVWDESFTPLAQVFSADASGLPVRGGLVYAIDAANPPTSIEVVQMTWTNLAMRTVISGGQVGMMALPDAGPLIS